MAGDLVDEDNVPIIESNRPPAIDHDLGEIARSFGKWAKGQKLSFASES